MSAGRGAGRMTAQLVLDALGQADKARGDHSH
jgi:hypothetical protein